MNRSRKQRPTRAWLSRWACRAGVVIACAVVALACRSYFKKDTLHLASRASGNAFAGAEWEAWVYSHRGTFRLNLNQVKWNYLTNPNPFPGSSGPRYYSSPADDEENPIPSGFAGAIGFDAFGFGAGRYSVPPPKGPEWSIRSHTAVRVPHWLLAVLFLVPALLSWSRSQRRRARGFDVLSPHPDDRPAPTSRQAAAGETAAG